jgi:D-serine deaminase-like pyridoxal phosphate-dependent protein
VLAELPGKLAVAASVHLQSYAPVPRLRRCEVDDIALSVLTTVIGHQPTSLDHRMPDSGAMSLADRFPIGTRRRILPNFACATGAPFSHYHAISAASPVTWKRFNGW